MTEKKNICVTIRSLSNGGAEKQSILLTSALQSAHNAFLLVLDEQPLLEKHLNTARKAGVELVFLKGNTLSKARQFFRLVRERKLEVIIGHLPSDTFFTGLLGRVAGVRYIFGGLRNAWVARHKLIAMQLMHNLVLNYSISNSHAGKKFLDKHGFNARKTLVYANGIEIQTPPIVRTGRDRVQAITVGRFVAQKDFMGAIDAVARVMQDPEAREVFHYHIVGYGELEADIRAHITLRGLDKAITVHINPPNLPELYQQADMYVCSSIFEGVSNTVMEAMMYSLPVVATDVGDNAVLVKNDHNGYIVPSKDPTILAGKITELIHSPDKRARFGQNSYEIIRDSYSFERFQQNYLSLIASLR
ncbi:MAG: glycosyltransferase [Bacteroidia bacterium]|nr:glycosyltransferase [Bacteroidia bacterium]